MSLIRDDGMLIIAIEDDCWGSAELMTTKTDRAGALGGIVTSEPGRCTVEIPYASS